MRRANSPRPSSDWDRTGLTGRHLSIVTPDADTSSTDEEWPVAYHIAGCGVAPRTHDERLQEYAKAQNHGVSLARQFRE